MMSRAALYDQMVEPSTLIPDGVYNARLVERRWACDVFEIQAPGTPEHGRRVSVPAVPITVRLRVTHQVRGDGHTVVNQGKVL